MSLVPVTSLGTPPNSDDYGPMHQALGAGPIVEKIDAARARWMVHADREGLRRDLLELLAEIDS